MRAAHHVADLDCDRSGDLFGPHFEQQHRHLVGELLRAEKTGERRDENEEREKRHQRRERDMAGDRPAVVEQERLIRGVEDGRASAKQVHGCTRLTVGAFLDRRASKK